MPLVVWLSVYVPARGSTHAKKARLAHRDHTRLSVARRRRGGEGRFPRERPEHPLTHWHSGNDVTDQVGDRLRHAARPAGGVKSSLLARRRQRASHGRSRRNADVESHGLKYRIRERRLNSSLNEIRQTWPGPSSARLLRVREKAVTRGQGSGSPRLRLWRVRGQLRALCLDRKRAPHPPSGARDPRHAAQDRGLRCSFPKNRPRTMSNITRETRRSIDSDPPDRR